jgi:acyl carrier protein
MTNSKKLISAFAEALGIEEEKVTDDLEYQEIPEWDSMAHMVLVNELEMTFDINLDTDEVIDLSSVGKSKEILNKHGIEF